MSELLNLFSSPVFWFATVFLSFFINLASAYIKPWIDDRLAQFSAQRKRLNELKKSQLDEAVSNMIFEETAVINEKVDLIRYLLRPTLRGCLKITRLRPKAILDCDDIHRYYQRVIEIRLDRPV